GTGITCNAGISDGLIAEVCPLTDSAKDTLKNVFDKMGLSARGYNRILKLSRTIADMSGDEVIDKQHIAGAVQFRTLDRQFWGR
ncbi:MAG: ATP-binding protein, partial [Oscillospiraceae bacterium]